MKSIMSCTPQSTGDQRCVVCGLWGSPGCWYDYPGYGYPVCPSCYNNLAHVRCTECGKQLAPKEEHFWGDFVVCKDCDTLMLQEYGKYLEENPLPDIDPEDFNF